MKNLLQQKSDVIYIDAKNVQAVTKIAKIIKKFILLEDKSDIIILCIGSDRVTGDSLGPITGYSLKQKLPTRSMVKIFGCLDSPVNAKNLEDTINMIYNTYKNPYIIAVDACLGRANYIGYITVGRGSLSPGAGVNKKLPKVGDMFISGIVNVNLSPDFNLIQTTRLGVVIKMAEIISSGLYLATTNV